MIHDTILPYSTFRIINEVDLMTKVQGHHNVVQLKGMWRIGGDVIFAMRYLHPCKFKELVAKIEVEEVKLYVANLMSALEHMNFCWSSVGLLLVGLLLVFGKTFLFLVF